MEKQQEKESNNFTNWRIEKIGNSDGYYLTINDEPFIRLGFYAEEEISAEDKHKILKAIQSLPDMLELAKLCSSKGAKKLDGVQGLTLLENDALKLSNKILENLN